VRQSTAHSLISLIVAGSLTVSQAAGPALGVAIARGGFTVDGSSVTDNATLFGGATIETERASSRLQLASGARVELAPRSRAKIFDDHVTLEKGSGELAAKDYQIEAQSLRISTDEARSLVRVSIQGSKSVLVTAVSGPVHVYNEIGLLVANVRPGMALAFQPQAGSPTASERSGCLMRSKEDSSKFILVDTVANVTVELRGEGLAEQVGNQVKITGTAFRSATPVTGAAQVIQVTGVQVVTKGGCGVAPAAAASAPRTPAPAATKTGMSNGAKIAIAVVAVGGGAGGIIAATAGGSKSR
jgi:hypothetical protein